MSDDERAPVTAFILAGGRGSRLAPLTTVIPKPLVPVGDASILEILVRQLVASEITDIVISLGFLGHLIEAVIGDGSRFGAMVTYTRETEPLGTAGALSLLSDERRRNTVVVLNGDTLTDLNFSDLIDGHYRSGADASIVIVDREMKIDFGVIEIDERGELDRYIEKPAIEYRVSIGINVFSAESLQEIDANERLDMPDFLLRLKGLGRVVRCEVSDCFWLDLGRIDDLRVAAEIVASEPGRFLA